MVSVGAPVMDVSEELVAQSHFLLCSLTSGMTRMVLLSSTKEHTTPNIQIGTGKTYSNTLHVKLSRP